jgi:hypothetical protein
MIPSSKWSLHKFFSKDPVIRSYLPPTALYQRSTLEAYLSKYNSVFIKPTNKYQGIGVHKVWKIPGGYQFVKERGEPECASTLDELRQKIRLSPRYKPYIIQKGIELAEVNGRPFDIRVMMMRNGRGKWQYAGMLAKVAGPDSIITNVARGGGYVTTVREALLQSKMMDESKISQVVRDLIALSYRVCRFFDKYRYSPRIGIDCAIDTSGKISIIEVNHYLPAYGMFADLKDNTYETMRRLAAEYRSWVKRKKRRKHPA